MSEPTVERLFDEFARAYLRGESPDVPAYLERAGSGRDDLGELIDRFLQAVPAQPASEEEIVLMQARLEQEPPLLVLRLRRKLSRGAVVDALVSTLGLDRTKRDKVAGYYHELEIGLLDPKPVSERVWDALAAVLGANARALAGLRPPPLAAEAHFRRVASAALESRELSAPALLTYRLRPPRRDEIDELFTGVS